MQLTWRGGAQVTLYSPSVNAFVVVQVPLPPCQAFAAPGLTRRKARPTQGPAIARPPSSKARSGPETREPGDVIGGLYRAPHGGQKHKRFGGGQKHKGFGGVQKHKRFGGGQKHKRFGGGQQHKRPAPATPPTPP